MKSTGRKYFQGRKYNYHYFDKIDNEEKAYWLGFLYGDGYIVPSKRTLGLTVASKDKSHLEKYALAVGLSSNDLKFYKAKTNFGEFESYRLLLSNKKIFEAITKQGFTSRKTSDPCNVKVKSNLIRHFIRGLFDADGSISTHMAKESNRIRYKADLELSVNEQVAYWFIKKLKKLGFTANISVKKDRNFYRVRANSLEAIEQFLSIVYKNANIYLERKKSSLEVAVIKLRNKARNSQHSKE